MTPEAYIAAYRQRETAIALQWSRQQGEVMHHVIETGLYLDDRGYHLLSQRQGRGRRPALRSARGKQVKRTRVEALIAAGFLMVEAGRVAATHDGYDAYMSWSLNKDTSVEVELDELPPLRGGEEATRRREAYEARMAAWQANLDAWSAANEARLAETEQIEAERMERKRAERAGRRFTCAADAIHTPDEVRTAADLAADLGNVTTYAAVSIDQVDELAGPVVIVPCGGRKLDTTTPVPAGELYTGSYHRAARRAAEVLTASGGRVLILSALHGLVTLDQLLTPYELRAGQPGTVTGQQLREQAAALGLADADVTVLGGRAYVDLARHVWPNAAAPLQGTRGIGEQLARLAAIYHGVPQDVAGRRIDSRAELVARRQARYIEAGPLHVAGGRARVGFTLPAAAGKGLARMAAALRFAGAYDVTAAQSGPLQLDVHGTPEQVARLVSALPGLLDLAEEYTTLAVRQYGRWERHSSARVHLADVEAAERRALARAFRRDAFEVVVDTLLDPAPAVPAADEAAPAWSQAEAIAGAIAEYGWVDVAERADEEEVAELLALAVAEQAELAVDSVVPVGLVASAARAPLGRRVRPMNRRRPQQASRPRRAARAPLAPAGPARGAGPRQSRGAARSLRA